MYEKRIRFWIRKTIKKQWFYWFVILLVFFNTCSVAVEHYDQPQWLTEFLGKFYLEYIWNNSVPIYIYIRRLHLFILYFYFLYNQIGPSISSYVCSFLKCYCVCGHWDQGYTFKPPLTALTVLWSPAASSRLFGRILNPRLVPLGCLCWELWDFSVFSKSRCKYTYYVLLCITIIICAYFKQEKN